MQDVVTKSPMKSIAFVVLCGSDKSKSALEFCLQRLDKLETEKTDISDIYVYLVRISEKGKYVHNKTFKEHVKSFENLKVFSVTGSTEYATEPRAYNYGIHAALDSPADYFVFLHETDIITDKNLLEYYMWLFDTAHNPEVVGAVAFSSSTPAKEQPKHVKMI